VKLKRSLFLLIRLAAGVATIGLLMHFRFIDLSALADTKDRPALLVLAALLMAALVPLAAFRWWLLLGGLGFRMSFGWTLRATLISLFFSTFLPGAYGGDTVRIALAYRMAGGGLSRLTFSVLVDRLCGLVALSVIGLCMLPSLHSGPNQAGYVVPLALVIFFVFGASVLGLLLGDRIVALISRLPSWFRSIQHVLNEAVGALKLYASRWRRMLIVIALSIAMFVMLLAAIAALGLAMGFDGLSLPGYFTAGAWAAIANSIPLTPGGLGVGEAAFAQLAHLLEPVPTHASYATAFLAMRVLNVLISVLGVLLYATHRQEVSRAVEQAAAESG
jgi:uncharacterized protein (TIRG00374 family)